MHGGRDGEARVQKRPKATFGNEDKLVSRSAWMTLK